MNGARLIGVLVAGGTVAISAALLGLGRAARAVRELVHRRRRSR
ncbi:hypothetical protein ACFYOV_17395 [Streptomyces sp. NPDC005931]